MVVGTVELVGIGHFSKLGMGFDIGCIPKLGCCPTIDHVEVDHNSIGLTGSSIPYLALLPILLVNMDTCRNDVHFGHKNHKKEVWTAHFGHFQSS